MRCAREQWASQHRQELRGTAGCPSSRRGAASRAAARACREVTRSSSQGRRGGERARRCSRSGRASLRRPGCARAVETELTADRVGGCRRERLRAQLELALVCALLGHPSKRGDEDTYPVTLSQCRVETRPRDRSSLSCRPCLLLGAREVVRRSPTPETGSAGSWSPYQSSCWSRSTASSPVSGTAMRGRRRRSLTMTSLLRLAQISPERRRREGGVRDVVATNAVSLYLCDRRTARRCAAVGVPPQRVVRTGRCEQKEKKAWRRPVGLLERGTRLPGRTRPAERGSTSSACGRCCPRTWGCFTSGL